MHKVIIVFVAFIVLFQIHGTPIKKHLYQMDQEKFVDDLNDLRLEEAKKLNIANFWKLRDLIHSKLYISIGIDRNAENQRVCQFALVQYVIKLFLIMIGCSTEHWRHGTLLFSQSDEKDV
uniref:Uncharacterized protein n=2 Tax=Caenorhabditis tropicalis TaxID=1561998 RepID=A0A1I7T1P0_9PELO